MLIPTKNYAVKTGQPRYFIFILFIPISNYGIIPDSHGEGQPHYFNLKIFVTNKYVDNPDSQLNGANDYLINN